MLDVTKIKGHVLFVGWSDFSRLVADEVYYSNKKIAIITARKDDIDSIYSKHVKEHSLKTQRKVSPLSGTKI